VINLPNPEIFLAIAVFVVAAAAARFRWHWLGCWERPIAFLARRKWLAVLLAGLTPMILRLALLPLYPPPQPWVHDEYSFLLAADTFLHGRLVNPVHPFWVHFESMHVLMQPVYASAFPIAPALAMAAGKLLFGSLWAGVWLSTGLMCGAICWMLLGWTPPRWALLGAVLVILRIGVSSYWMNSFWGGSLAAAAGAVVLGALPRLFRRPRWPHAVAMGVGLAVLANSRPVEGGWFGLVIAVPLFAWMLRRNGPSRGVAVRQVILPLTIVLGLTAIGMGYYFAQFTGKPWVVPYVLYRETRTVATHFIWQHPRPEPLYNNREMRMFYAGKELSEQQAARTPAWFLRKTVYWRFYLGPLLSIPLLSIVALWRSRRTRPLLLMAAGFSLVLLSEVWHSVHYAAPGTGLAILIVVMGMRYLRTWRRRRGLGLYLVRALPWACAAMLTMQIVAGGPAGEETRAWRWPPAGDLTRAAVLTRLQQTPGDHLVFVRYAEAHDPGKEWVYNSADIDHAKVVFARELDPASNQKLMRYFSARTVWLVEPDSASGNLRPYADAPARPMYFVSIGAPGIEVLRSAPEVRARVLEKAGADTPRSCVAWNRAFTDATGVEGPAVSGDCGGGDVSFDRWFAWLLRQPLPVAAVHRADR
jgi:hypothetical protein